MPAEVQITLRGLQPSDALERRIRQKVARLETLHPGAISRCRVVAGQPQARQGHGPQFVVRLELWLRGREIVVNRDDNKDIYVALRDAFNGARRQLDAWMKPDGRAGSGPASGKAAS